MPIPHARRMNLIALALLITALIAFGAFHFLIIEIYPGPSLSPDLETVGWQVWPSLVETLGELHTSGMQPMVTISAFVTSALLVVACPFLVPVLRISRLIWWITVITSGAAMCGWGGVILMEPTDPTSCILGPGSYCLLASLALNFLGLLFIRREVTAAPEVDR
jgi:hypothetical protein